MWVEPIYSRTELDVTDKTPIGRCNYTDINRLEGNCEVLAAWGGVSIQTKSWERNALPNVSDFARIRSNINTLRNTMGIYQATPPTPPNPLNTWDRWNDAERILYDIYKIYKMLMDSILYTGEIYSGEQIGVI